MDRITDQQIQKMFCQYVQSRINEERHSAPAVNEVNAYDSFLEEKFDRPLQIELYEKMMNVAVEFEESGFVAGFRWCMDLTAQYNSYTDKADGERRDSSGRKMRLKGKEKIDKKDRGIEGPHISSRQVGAFFGKANCLVCERIENKIWKQCTEEEMKHFVKAEEYTKSNRIITVYHMDEVAAGAYLRYMREYGNHNCKTKEGIRKMEECVKQTFRYPA